MQLLVNSLITASHVVLLGCGFLLILSLARFFNFAHGAIFLLGPYLALALAEYVGLHLGLACGLGILVATTTGVLLDIGLFRPLARRRASGLILLLASLGVYVVLENLVSLAMGTETHVLWQRPAQVGYAIGDARITAIQVATIITAVFAAGILVLGLRRSRAGLWLRAVADDEELAACSGIPYGYVRTVSFAVGSALAAISGVLSGLDVPLNPTMGLQPLMLCVVAAVLAAPYGMVGIVGAAVVLGLARSYGAWVVGTEWQDATVFVLFLVALLSGNARCPATKSRI